MWLLRGHEWLPGGGACLVTGGHAWLPGGVHGCWGEHAWLPVGHVWLLWHLHGCRGACVVVGGHAWLQGGVHRIRRDMVNERAVRILLECILVCLI